MDLQRLKEWMYLLYYFVKFMVYIEPLNLIKAVFAGIGIILKNFLSLFAAKEEQREYTNILIILVFIEMALIVARNRIDLRLFGYHVTVAIFFIILIFLFLKVKKEGKWKYDYRQRFIFKK